MKPLVMSAGAVLVCAGAFTWLRGQGTANFFDTVDANRDGFITRDELKSAMSKWASGPVTQPQLVEVLDAAFPESAVAALFSPPGPQNQTPKPDDVARMEAALPSAAPAKPLRPRRVLVLSKAAGFVHSCIPLAAKTVEELGTKTGAWATDVSYDSAVINADNLKKYDLVFLNNTTGAFLDDPSDAAATAARKKALLDFVHSGKGLAGIHAAGDSYHKANTRQGFGSMLAPLVVNAADKNGDKSVTAEELSGLADTWFERIDRAKAGKVSVNDFKSRFMPAVFSSGPRRGAPAAPQHGRPGLDPQVGTWPEFNEMIGGFFKWHWLNPTHIVYKIDDPKSPLTAMFLPGPFSIDDETYTFSMRTWSRKKLHVLTSIDYAQMSDADKAKEDYPREDHDYGLSWIHRAGKGRVFYEAHGHDEKVYANKQMLEHLLAGVQYALGDLKADDSPSVASR
jgi:type 1 glutamine amidotransferase